LFEKVTDADHSILRGVIRVLGATEELPITSSSADQQDGGRIGKDVNANVGLLVIVHTDKLR